MPKKIVLDAGHGGLDSGAVFNGRKEKDDVLKLCNRIKYNLEKKSVSVAMTRTQDETVDLWQRTSLENYGKYDLFISIHRNAYRPEQARGVETYSLATVGAGSQLSQKIQSRLVNYFYNRGCKTKGYYVLKYTNCPAVLVEVGFIDNSNDNDIFDSHIEDIAIDISKSIMEQLGVAYIEPYEPPESGTIFYRVTVDGVTKGSYTLHEGVLSDTKKAMIDGAKEINIKRVVKN